jgi:predicted metal-binding membrane protein
MTPMDPADVLAPWSAGYLGATALMWMVMMAAMMLPSATPMIRLFALSSRRKVVQTAAPTMLFVGGYFLAWAGFSIAATFFQALLRDFALLSPELLLLNPWMISGVLFVAGVYQFTRWKTTCLSHCQSPLAFLLRHWQDGRRGALAMGLRHGLYCVGCCWALMLVLFTVGVMNLVWVAVIAIVILLEKLVARGPWLSRLAGAALMGWAVVRLAT